MAQTDFDKMLNDLYNNTVPVIDVHEIQKLLKSGEEIIFLDIRSDKEYKVSHIPEALFFPYKEFDPGLVDPSLKQKKVIVYCSIGYRSERAGQKLLEYGFESVYNLYGGIFQWVNEDYNVINENNEPTDSVHTYNKKWSKWLLKGKKVYE